MKKITICDIQRLKGNDTPFATITAYDYISAQCADAVGIPLVLVGDSAAMVVYGHKTTLPATVEMMEAHVSAVSRGLTGKPLIADMPFLAHRKGFDLTMDAVDTAIGSQRDRPRLAALER